MTERVSVGRVGKPHGFKGAFFVEQPSEHAERYALGAKFFAGEREVEVVEFKRGSGGRPVIRLDQDVPRGTALEVERDDLPELGDDTYYIFQLVGLEVERVDGKALGRVHSVDPGVANDVLVLESGLLLPLVAACVREVDLEAGRIVVETGFDDAD
ncbi:MAG: ribosome maturation factor RimM [Gaiellaceae bacterium]